jgi:hypothetical protein
MLTTSTRQLPLAASNVNGPWSACSRRLENGPKVGVSPVATVLACIRPPRS